MKNRSYIGDGVYVHFEGKEVVLALEQGRGICLNRQTFHALLEYIQKHDATFDPCCQIVEVPTACFEKVVKDLKALGADVKPTLDG